MPADRQASPASPGQGSFPNSYPTRSSPRSLSAVYAARRVARKSDPLDSSTISFNSDAWRSRAAPLIACADAPTLD